MLVLEQLSHQVLHHSTVMYTKPEPEKTERRGTVTEIEREREAESLRKNNTCAELKEQKTQQT